MRLHKETAAARAGAVEGYLDQFLGFHPIRRVDPAAKDPVVAQAEAVCAAIQEAKEATEGRLISEE